MAGRLRFRDFARWTVSRYGFASNDRMTHLLRRLLKVKTFEELKRRSKHLETVEPAELSEIIHRSQPR